MDKLDFEFLLEKEPLFIKDKSSIEININYINKFEQINRLIQLECCTVLMRKPLNLPDNHQMIIFEFKEIFIKEADFFKTEAAMGYLNLYQKEKENRTAKLTICVSLVNKNRQSQTLLNCQIKGCFALSYEKFGLNITSLLIIFHKNFATLSMIKGQNSAFLITDPSISDIKNKNLNFLSDFFKYPLKLLALTVVCVSVRFFSPVNTSTGFLNNVALAGHCISRDSRQIPVHSNEITSLSTLKNSTAERDYIFAWQTAEDKFLFATEYLYNQDSKTCVQYMSSFLEAEKSFYDETLGPLFYESMKFELSTISPERESSGYQSEKLSSHTIETTSQESRGLNEAFMATNSSHLPHLSAPSSSIATQNVQTPVERPRFVERFASRPKSVFPSIFGSQRRPYRPLKSPPVYKLRTNSFNTEQHFYQWLNATYLNFHESELHIQTNKRHSLKGGFMQIIQPSYVTGNSTFMLELGDSVIDQYMPLDGNTYYVIESSTYFYGDGKDQASDNLKHENLKKLLREYSEMNVAQNVLAKKANINLLQSHKPGKPDSEGPYFLSPITLFGRTTQYHEQLTAITVPSNDHPFNKKLILKFALTPAAQKEFKAHVVVKPMRDLYKESSGAVNERMVEFLSHVGYVLMQADTARHIVNDTMNIPISENDFASRAQPSTSQGQSSNFENDFASRAQPSTSQGQSSNFENDFVSRAQPSNEEINLSDFYIGNSFHQKWQKPLSKEQVILFQFAAEIAQARQLGFIDQAQVDSTPISYKDLDSGKVIPLKRSNSTFF